MRNLFFPFLLTCCFFSCSDDNGKDGPEPVNPGELVLTVDDAPSRVKVGTTSEFTLKAVQDGRTDAFPLRIDTVGHFSLTLNNVSYPGVSSLNPDADVLVKFTPLSVGENRITFNLTGSDSKKLSKVVSITSFLPEVSMSFSSVGDSVSVKDVTEFTFTVDGDAGEEYEVRIDTVVPEFKLRLTDHDGYYTETLLRRGVDLMVNGESLPEVLKVKPGVVNTFSFSNPQCIGDYHILFTVTDKYGNGKEFEKVIRAYSPEDIVIDFLEVDAEIELGLGWHPEEYYEKLNTHFDYSSLPSYFDGKHVDTIYTVEQDMAGHPGETTIPGRGMIVYIGQGEEPELFIKDISFNDRLMLTPQWDNRDNSPLQKTGLHALNFNTNSADNNPGTETYTLTIADKYGKIASKTLTIIALPYGSEMPYPDDVWRRRYDWTTHVDPVK